MGDSLLAAARVISPVGGNGADLFVFVDMANRYRPPAPKASILRYQKPQSKGLIKSYARAAQLFLRLDQLRQVLTALCQFHSSDFAAPFNQDVSGQIIPL